MTSSGPTPPRRYRLDANAERFGTTLVGGSPLRLFRLTGVGAAVVDRCAAGHPVEASPLVDRLLDAGVLHPVGPSPSDPSTAHPSSAGSPDPSVPFGADDVTIVMPALGTPAEIPPGAIVVDDGSDPPVVGATLRLESNLGPAAARNAGLTRVTTPLVAFVDADVELPADWLAQLLPHFADPRVGLVAPRVVAAPDASTSSVLGRYEQTHGSLDMGPEAARVRAGTRVSYVPTAAVVCRTDAVRAVGGFDDALRFGEDVDLVWRLDGAGWRCRYEPAAVVGHRPRPIWRAWLRQRIDYGSSAAPLARRHPGALAPLRMSPWSIGCWLLVLAGRPALGGAIGIGSAAALVPRLPTLPAPAAFRLAALGNLRAGRQIAHATRRAWLPLVAVAALRSRLARRTLLASLVCVGHPIEVVDDVAYGVGVWKGMIEHRTIDPIIPEVRSWPGRSSSRRAASDGP